jgi:hypothetical protein
MFKRSGLISVFAAGVLMLFTAASTMAEEKPQLTDELKVLIESEGVAAAQQHFSDVYPAQKETYNIDVQKLLAMAGEYMQVGNAEAAQAVAGFSNAINQEMFLSAMATQAPEMQKQMDEMRRAEEDQQSAIRSEEEQLQESKRARDRGKTRSDLPRFSGLYGDPSDNRHNRHLWVSMSCDGYLVAGPQWADVSPWWMRSAADTVFTYSDSFTSLAFEFDSGTDGQSQSLSHDLDSIASPLKRIGPLPAEWEKCVAPPIR